MTRRYLDTVHLLALLNPKDEWHHRAVELSAEPGVAFVTTNSVLTEVADAFCRPDRRAWAAQAIRDLLADPNVECIDVDQRLFEQALQLYERRPDKEWSLTDCISFVVMSSRGLREALTADAHFAQAGFEPLLLG
jgi:predicted nucleic acid-binding protein